jgi:hypothetical protein
LKPDKPLRIAHLSDMHVEPDPTEGPRRRSDLGFTRALEAAQALTPAVDLIITGGDHIMDALERDERSSLEQWDTYLEVLNKYCRLPVYPVIGNHDIFGWMNPTIPTDHPLYGKQMPLERLGMVSPYYSFDRGGWHFIVLDNSQLGGRGYYGAVDPPQLDWLKNDLRQTGKTTPICVLTHIPILSVCAQQFFQPGAGITFWEIPDVFVMKDSRSLTDLFTGYNIRLCLAAHIHMRDRIEFQGITYITTGAIAANWWKGPFNNVPEGFGLIDFYPDGRFDYQYLPTGWQAVE